MLYKPPIQPGAGTFDTPCSVSYIVSASPEWLRDTPEQDQQRVANIILGQNQSLIAQFVATARQERQLGEMQGQRKAVAAPGLTVELTFNFGIEVLRIIVYPESVGSKSSQDLDFGGSVEIKCDFISFPYPGMPQLGGRLVPIDLQYTGTQYVYDPGFSPSGPGLTSKTEKGILKCADPVMAPDLNLTAGPQSLFIRSLSTAIPQPVDGSGSSANGTGYDDLHWCPGVGGSGILTTPVSGKQYWEVKVTKLPTAVPDPFISHIQETAFHSPDPSNPETLYGVAWDGTIIDRDNGHFDQNGWSMFWLPSLNTFFSPAIGVCPGYFLPADLLPGDPLAKPRVFQDFGRVLGLDQELDVESGPLNERARSIYAVTVSSMQGLQTTKTYHQGTWAWHSNPTSSIASDNFTNFPAPNGLAWPNYIVSLNGLDYTVSNGSSVFSSTNRFLSGDPQSTLPMDTVSHTYDSSLGPPDYPLAYPPTTTPGAPRALAVPHRYGRVSGPPDGTTGMMPVYTPITGAPDWFFPVYADVLSYASSTYGAPFIWQDNNWEVLGVEGQFYGPYSDYLIHTPGSYNAPTSRTWTYGDLGVLGGFDLTVPDSQSFVDVPLPYSDKWLAIRDVNTPQMPVFIGRLDNAYDPGITTSDGTDQAMDSSASQVDEWGDPIPTKFARYTGVNLGPPVEGDIIMMATDTETGYVWFGKNGTWMGPDGAIDAKVDGPAHGTKYAAVMDGMPKSSLPITGADQPQYFPCVSYRLGPVAMKMIYDQARLKYPAPAGFKIYGQKS